MLLSARCCQMCFYVVSVCFNILVVKKLYLNSISLILSSVEYLSIHTWVTLKAPNGLMEHLMSRAMPCDPTYGKVHFLSSGKSASSKKRDCIQQLKLNENLIPLLSPH